MWGNPWEFESPRAHHPTDYESRGGVAGPAQYCCSHTENDAINGARGSALRALHGSDEPWMLTFESSAAAELPCT